MAAVRFSVLKSLGSLVKASMKLQSASQLNGSVLGYTSYVNSGFRTLSSISSLGLHNYKEGTVHSRLGSRTAINVGLASNVFRFGSHPMSFGTKSEKPENLNIPSATNTNEASNSIGGSEWVDMVKGTWQSTKDAVNYTGQKAKDASDELTPHVQQLLETYPYLKNVFVPVCFTLTGIILAWVVMPRILKRFHKYSLERPSLLTGGFLGEPVPYEKSFWGALEDPVRYAVTFMAFSQIAMMVAPTTIAAQYAGQASSGAVTLAFIWFLYRWKTNMFARALASQTLAGLDRDKILTLDKISSIGLFLIGSMTLSEACGVAVQSILTVGGIGGVATAFAAKDILGNILSGLSMQFSKPFSIGDTIKAGSIEGQVVEMGLTTTLLRNVERFPVIVPNSLFSSQVIVNKSRAGWRAMTSTIPLQIDDLHKIPLISDDIKAMLRCNSKVFLEKEAPYCFMSRVESSFAELRIGCNLKQMSKDELYSTQQDILIQSVQIIKKHGAALGSTWENTARQ